MALDEPLPDVFDVDDALPSPVDLPVDAFSADAIAEIDALRARNLQIMTELHTARMRLQGSSRPERGRLRTAFFGGDLTAPSERKNPDLEAQFESAAVVVRTTTAEARRAAASTRSAAEADAETIVEAAHGDADNIRESAIAEAAMIRAQAQAGAERLLREAHQRVAELTAPDMMQRLDDVASNTAKAVADSLRRKANQNPTNRVAPVVDLAGSAGVNPVAPRPSSGPITPTARVAARTAIVIPPLVQAAESSIAVSPTTETSRDPGPTTARISPARFNPLGPIDPEIKEERTFAALWNAGDEAIESDVADFFRNLPYNDRGLF